MKKCKDCGCLEWGYGSLLNDDGYCPNCAMVHYNETIRSLKSKIEKLEKQLKDANDAITFMVGNGSVRADDVGEAYIKKWEVEF